MKLHNVSISLAQTKSSTLVIFAASDGHKLVCDCKGCSCDISVKLIETAHKEKRFKGGAKETVFFRSVGVDGFEHVLVVGLGAKSSVDEESLRIAFAVAVKTLNKEKVLSATVCVQSIRKFTKDAELAGRAAAEGAILGSYYYDEVKSKKEDLESRLTSLYFALDDKVASKKFGAGVATGEILGESTNFARNLANAPGNFMTPKILAEKTHAACKGLPIKFKALSKTEMKELGMGCILGVNAGSSEEPRFIIMEYSGGKKADKPFILVGKGLTFDAGGISIKPSAAMEEMKFDMCGGAAVIGATLALARLKAKVNVVTLVPSTENLPDGAAVKPGDVLIAMNGKTIEVNNTDAEGRLILADALSYACAKYKPAAIVDAATLTGACVVALGNVFAGYFSKNEKLLKQIRTAADSSGERIWQLPLVDEYLDDMKGVYADLSNVSNAKGGGSSQGAAFLSQFVTEDIPWAHFDIAGVAYHTGGRKPYNPDKGASGSAVRLFADLAMSL